VPEESLNASPALTRPSNGRSLIAEWGLIAPGLFADPTATQSLSLLSWLEMRLSLHERVTVPFHT
jgi:hypothetical protein